MNEFLAGVEWQTWLPIAIAAISLLLSWRQARRSARRETLLQTEQRIDRAAAALTECEENLKRCGHEKDELRRENIALLQQIAEMARAQPGE